MAGMEEQQTEWQNRMADGMVEWQEWREWRNGRKKWQNGRMAEMATYVLFMVYTNDDTKNDNDTF